jgi:hypothetical protein
MTIQRQKTLENIKAIVAEKHVNVKPAHYAEWASMLDHRASQLLEASALDFHEEVNRSLATLQTSHTAFLNPGTETVPWSGPQN